MQIAHQLDFKYKNLCVIIKKLNWIKTYFFEKKNQKGLKSLFQGMDALNSLTKGSCQNLLWLFGFSLLNLTS